MVEPAVVEAVAPAIRIPDKGASTKAGIFIASNKLMTSYCKAEALMIPAIVPVPINSTETPITLLKPNSIYSLVRLMLPVARMLTRPPTGSAIRGSTLISNSGRSARRMITTNGPLMAAAKPGSFLSA